MMSDIVTKMCKAADEITRLREEVERVKNLWMELDSLTYSFDSRERMKKIRAEALQEPK